MVKGKRENPVQSIVTNRPIRSKDDYGLAAALFSPAHLALVTRCCFELNLINGVVYEKLVQFVSCYVDFGLMIMIRNRSSSQTLEER